MLGKCLLHSCLKSLNELSPGKARPRRVGSNIESPMQLLHSQCGANFIVYVKPLTMLSPRSTPSYNDHLALLNWYLRVVLETLSYATFWCHKGLCKPNVPILCRDGIHLNHKGLSIGDFARIAGPLHQLGNNCLQELKVEKKLKVPFEKRWNSESQTAFDALEIKLTHAPVLGFANYRKPSVLETDASHVGLEAVLSQDQDGQYKVIAYVSRRLRPSEKNPRNYSFTKLELLALKWAVTEKFRTYLLGSKFEVYTEKNPLMHMYLQTTAKLGALEQRWVAQLALIDFTISYRSGRSNANADALSHQGAYL